MGTLRSTLRTQHYVRVLHVGCNYLWRRNANSIVLETLVLRYAHALCEVGYRFGWSKMSKSLNFENISETQTQTCKRSLLYLKITIAALLSKLHAFCSNHRGI